MSDLGATDYSISSVLAHLYGRYRGLRIAGTRIRQHEKQWRDPKWWSQLRLGRKVDVK